MLGKQDPSNDYFANMWEDSFICGTKQPLPGPWMQASLQTSFPPLQADHFQQQQQHMLLQQQHMRDHHQQQEQEGRQRVQLQRMISQQARQLLADEQLLLVDAQHTQLPLTIEQAAGSESVSSHLSPPPTSGLKAAGSYSDRRQSSASGSGSQSAGKQREAPVAVKEQTLQRTRRQQAQLLQQQALQKVEQNATPPVNLLAQQQQQLESKQPEEQQGQHEQLQPGIATPFAAVSLQPSSATGPLPPTQIHPAHTGALVVAVSTPACPLPVTAAHAAALTATAVMPTASVIPSVSPPAITCGPLMACTDIPHISVSALQQPSLITSLLPLQPSQSVALLPPSLPLTWSVPGLGAEPYYPQVWTTVVCIRGAFVSKKMLVVDSLAN